MPLAALPPVAITGVPSRFGGTSVATREYWEWLLVTLATGGQIAVFDPDHLCAPGWFGRPCQVALEFFHPRLDRHPLPGHALVLPATTADPTAAPSVVGQVLDEHREQWRYTGPVTTQEGTRRVVHHVIDAPQVTLRLVLDIGIGTVLVQLRDPAEIVPPGSWVGLHEGRVDVVGITLQDAG